MLSICDSSGRFNRRSFLHLGGLAALGSLIPGLAGKAFADSQLYSGKSVIFLFMHGGPSQFETFDPKMTAPSEVRSTTGEIKTTLPGITFGGTFPKLARQAHRCSIVRSFVTGDGNHDIKPIVSADSSGANLGCILSQTIGASHPISGMPANVALFPQTVAAASEPAQTSFGNFLSTGPFGFGMAPLVPGSNGQFQKNLKLAIPLDRMDDRLHLLKQFDSVRRWLDEPRQEGLNSIRANAYRVLLGSVADAFDLEKEDPRVIDQYDTQPLMRADQIDKKWNNYKYYRDNAATLGKLLLLARRLCERGCGFVTVTTNFVWDMHADVNNAPLSEGMRYVGLPFDHAVSAFLEDVALRGLSDRILLVCCGEMGRTPRVNKLGGRDHWGNLAPLLLAGGGLPMGQVIGRSTSNGGEPATDPVTNRNLIATILQTLLNVGKLRTMSGVPREIQRMLDWSPITALQS
jgi:Protein of unknown function (DUF1501)